MAVVTDSVNKIEVPCPICGSESYITIYPDTLGEGYPVFGYQSTPDQMKAYRVVRCTNCGHGYASPRPLNMYEKYEDVIDSEYLKTSPVRTLTSIKVVNRIKKIKPTGNLLDVGCSTGDFLDVCDGFIPQGIELSEWAATIAKQKGLDVYKYGINDIHMLGKYDVITMFGVIEHLENPLNDLQCLSNALNDDGIICIWTGNLDGFASRILKQKWYYIQGQHIQYFTDHSLDVLMNMVGLKKVWSGMYPYVMDCKYISKSLNRYKSISKISNTILNSNVLKNQKITVKIPGEMFVIYKKSKS